MRAFPLQPPSNVEILARAPLQLAPDTLLAALLEAASEAERAEEELEAARAEYERAPSEGTRERLREESGKALEKEARFDDLWRSASQQWFAAPATSVAPPRRWPGASP